MAKYTVVHSCGHERVVNLVGKTADRERKLEWMARQECPQCWGAKKREQEETEPITMTIMSNGLDKDTDGDILAEVVLTGGTRPRKDEIKALGYFWGDVRGGVMNFLSAKRPEMAWQKNVKLIDLLENKTVIEQFKADAAQLGAKIKNGLNALDAEMAKNAIAEREAVKVQKAAQDRMIAKLDKPERPACHPRAAHPGEYWNGKYYGNDRRGYEYYVAGNKVKLSDAEYNVCMEYRTAMTAYNEQVKAIREGKVELIEGASEDAPQSRKERMSQVMKRAWAIAKAAAQKLGVKVKEIVFGECLKQAWAEARA